MFMFFAKFKPGQAHVNNRHIELYGWVSGHSVSSIRLRQERTGILTWAVEDCREWREVGLCPPDIIKSATASYCTDIDSVFEFLDEETVKEDGASVKKDPIYQAYRSWCL
jgi:phage/plasmid-associated DNA primase